jgi:predicted transcriptional regulator
MKLVYTNASMKRIELELDEETLERAQQLAAARQCSLEELIKDLLKQTEAHKPLQDPYLGMLADEPELIDRVTESAMEAREEHPLRTPCG